MDAGTVLLDDVKDPRLAACDDDALVIAGVLSAVEEASVGEGATELPVPYSLGWLEVSLCDSFSASSSLFSEAGETA